MRELYHGQLEKLNRGLVEMGQILVSQIQDALSSLEKRDSKMAKKVIERDKQVNDLEKEIEHLCLSLLLLQQPVADDLRNVSSGLKMITDMERIGDQAADIADLVLDLQGEAIKELDAKVHAMYEEVLTMVINVIDAFEKKNSNEVLDVIQQDDKVDQMLEDLKNTVIALIQGHSELSHGALDYFMVAKHLEKIGDYAVNVARWINYYLNGEVMEKE